ncbi:hypothetical protein K523DRAFT_266926 [Schizophyllum commune Tattone D]|nr:hypothetical protein K523DRAFT_266926 [Schizophyllum commune Tattone D]
MRERTVARMEYEEFVAKFIPTANYPAPNARYRLVCAISDATAPCSPLIRGISQVLKGLSVSDTSAHSSESERDLLISPGVYVDLRDCTQYNEAVTDLVEDYLDFDIFDNSVDLSALTSEATDKGRDVAKQVMAYLAKMHNRQHRLFSPFLFANAGYFRIIRMDRAGLIVSDKRLWDESDRFRDLDDLLHRFDNLSPEEQGSDSTVRHVPKEDAILEARARAALEPYVPLYKRDLPVLEIKVPVDSGATSGWRSFYVWAPERDAYGVCTRATLSCPAWCPIEDKVFFLKDSWRPLHAEREADVIRQLNEHGVRYAPALVCGGDLPDQQTITHVYLGDDYHIGEDKACRPTPRVHHRLVEHFYRPLWEFRSSKHLLQILDNVCTCHRETVEKCQKLHRDLSFRNIMWDDEKQEGILVDWDMCAPTPSPPDRARDPTLNPLAQLPSQSGHPDRTGTWLFMSSSLLMTPGKLHTVQDDLESLFWVALYIIILYFPCGDIDVVPMIDRIFYEIEADDGTARGGMKKGAFLDGKGFPALFDLPDSVSEPLAIWVSMYRGMLSEWVKHDVQLTALREELTAFEKKHGKGVDRWGRSARLRKALAETERAQPDLRDYEELQSQWKAIVEQGEEEGLFIENDRLTDDDHQHSPEHILKLYRARRAATDRQEQLDRASANQQAIAARSQDSGSQSGQGVRRKRDSDEPQAGSSRGTTLLGSGQSDDMGEGDTEDEAAGGRPTKRPRKPTQSDSGADAKGKGRRTRD